jgi:uncharacterized phiE125 gp8 family phage protein
MVLYRIAAPTEAVVTLASVKQALIIETSYHDARLADHIATAIAKLDGRDGILGRCLMPQRWRLTMAGFPYGGIHLPLPPTRTVDAVTYLDATGEERSFAASGYRVLPGGFSGATVRRRSGINWPVTACEPDAVRVDFSAGYDADDPDLDVFRQAIRLTVKYWFDGNPRDVIPDAAEQVISNHRFAPL